MPYIHSVYNEIAKRSELRLDIEILLSTRMSTERKMSGSGDVERLEKIAAEMDADQKSDRGSQQGQAENNSAVAQREAQWGEWKDNGMLPFRRQTVAQLLTAFQRRIKTSLLRSQILLRLGHRRRQTREYDTGNYPLHLARLD